MHVEETGPKREAKHKKKWGPREKEEGDTRKRRLLTPGEVRKDIEEEKGIPEQSWNIRKILPDGPQRRWLVRM